MVKILLPIAGCIATVALLTSAPFAKVAAHQKAYVAAAILGGCFLLGALISRLGKPKPKAAPQRPGYPFGGQPR